MHIECRQKNSDTKTRDNAMVEEASKEEVEEEELVKDMTRLFVITMEN